MKYFTRDFKIGDSISATELHEALRPFSRKLNTVEAFAVLEIECRERGDIQPVWETARPTYIEFITPFKKFLDVRGHYKAPISNRAKEYMAFCEQEAAE